MAKTVWEEEADSRWPEYEGELDAALASLRESDRKAIMLRFYEHKSFDEIARILGTAEEAARKRVSRAVEKMRGFFGVASRTLPATAVTYYLATKMTSQAAPGLASKVAANAVHSAAAAAASATPQAAQLAQQITQHMAIMKAKWVVTSIAAVLLISVTGGIIVFQAMGSSTNPQPTQQVQHDFRIR